MLKDQYWLEPMSAAFYVCPPQYTPSEKKNCVLLHPEFMFHL